MKVPIRVENEYLMNKYVTTPKVIFWKMWLIKITIEGRH